ncbi:MAG TPA: DUF58 domain-containing protein, partial [Methanomassiliicoccales archaeon]|nr:DUF58 domain-containing protein [Methanomassiliicoccales archaeon]
FPRRGRYDLGSIKIRTSRTVLSRNEEMVIDCHKNVKVLPVVYPLERSPFRPVQVRLPSGNVISSLLGPGLEFHSMRDYAPGDEQRFINWKATAHRGAVMVNDYHSERSGDVVLVVDARSSVKGRARSDRLVDREADAAASLAAFYLRQRDRVGLMIIGDYMDVVRPAYGRRQFQMIVDRLLEIRRGWSRSSTSLAKVMQRHFPAQSLILLISPLDDPGLVRAVRELDARGHTMAVLSPYEEDVIGGDGPSAELYSRLKRLKRTDDLFLISHHSQVLEWNIDDPLPTALRRYGR